VQILVKLKAWQVSILVFGIPMLGIFFYFWSFHPLPDSAGLHIAMIMAVFWANASLWIWIWSIGYKLSVKHPSNARTVPLFFAFAIVYSLVFLLVFSVIAIYRTLNKGTDLYTPEALTIIALMCNIYCLYYASKVVVEAEKQVIGKSENNVLTFFEMLFFPFGIWFIQPRINRIWGKKPA